MKYLFYPLLFIFCSSCADYQDVKCSNSFLNIQLTNFTLRETDSILITEFEPGSEFTDTVSSRLYTRADTDRAYYNITDGGHMIYKYGTNSIILTLTLTGSTYHISALQYAGKETERQKVPFDMSGSGGPKPCFNNFSTATVDGQKTFFDTRETAVIVLPRK